LVVVGDESMIKISLDASIYSLIKEHNEIKEIMIELGFKDIVKTGMLQSVGRIMNLEKGSKMKDISLDIIRQKFKTHGFIVE